MGAIRAIAMALLLGTVTASGAVADEPSQTKTSCFHISDLGGWKTTADARTLYIRVNARRVFRLGLAGRCSLLLSPDAYLVTTTRGSDFVCRPIDWDLKVAQEPGGTMGCIVKEMQELTPAEAAALPKKLRP